MRSKLNIKKEIISPCITVCRLDLDGICIGCKRTRKEIKEWRDYSPKRRKRIIDRLSM